MYIDTYLDKVIPYLKILIDEKKISNQKIQFDVGINLIDLAPESSKRFTFWIKTDYLLVYSQIILMIY